MKEGSELDVLPIDGKVSKGYKPEGFDSQEAFLQDMREQYAADIDYDRFNRNAALDDKKFAAGEQWDPLVLEQRKGLPCMVINSIPQFTAQLVGDWREARKGIKVLPTSEEDADIASVRADIIRGIEAASRADRVYDGAFESLVQCGDGAFRIAVEYARDSVFDQDIFIRPIEDALAVVWDRYSADPTGRDAKHVFVDDRLPKKEFHRKWPDIQPSTLGGDDLLGKTDLSGWVDDESYRVSEYWRLIERQRLLGLFANGKIFELEGDDLERIIAENGPPVKTRMSWCTYAQMHLVTGFAILSGPYEYRLNRLPIIRMSGRVTNIAGRRVRFGLVRFMKDSVRLRNFFRSVAAEQIGYAPKAKWMATESAVEGREDQIRKAHLSRDPLLVFNDEAVFGQNVQRVDPPGIEAALLNEAAVNTQDMKDVTGIHDASLGIKSNETSGRAIMARQREGDIANLTFHDNGNAALLEGGDVINQLIPQVMDGTRILRGIGEDEGQKFIRVNDPMDPEAIDLSIGQFDVALSTGASYTTRRQEAAQAMMDAVQVFPQLMSVAGDLVAKAQDWPGADKIAERLEAAMQTQQVDPAQVQQTMQDLEKLKMENETLKLEMKNKTAENEIAWYKAETDRIKALSDHEVDANQTEQDAIAMLLDAHKTADEHDMRRDEVEAQHSAGREDAERNHEMAKESLKSKSAPTGQSTSAGKKKSQSGKANG